MKLAEARQVIGYIINWGFVLQGVIERDEVKLDHSIKDLSLEDLIKANKMVKSANDRKRKLQEYNRGQGRNVKGVSINMTLDDRLIASVYTALHYPVGNEITTLINDRAVAVVKPNY